MHFCHFSFNIILSHWGLRHTVHGWGLWSMCVIPNSKCIERVNWTYSINICLFSVTTSMVASTTITTRWSLLRTHSCQRTKQIYRNNSKFLHNFASKHFNQYECREKTFTHIDPGPRLNAKIVKLNYSLFRATGSQYQTRIHVWIIIHKWADSNS